MAEDKKLYAKFEWDDYRNDGDTNIVAEVKDLAEAAAFGTKKGADFFTTYEVSTVTVGSRTFTGEPENKSGRNYLRQEKVYTPAEVIRETGAETSRFSGALEGLLKELERDGISLGADFKKSAGGANPLLEQCKKDGADVRYAKLRYKGFVRIEAGETAWDAKGRQLWPSTAPAAPKIRPTGEFDL